MYLQHPDSHYNATDDGAFEIERFGINEIKNYNK